MPKPTSKTITTRSVQRIVEGALKRVQEHKAMSADIAAADVNTTGLVQPITQHIVQGDTYVTRDGNEAILEQLVVRWNTSNLEPEAAGVKSRIAVRFIVFKDTMNGGTLPAITDVLASSSVWSAYNGLTVIQQKRFQILTDKVLDLVSGTHKESISMTIVHNMKLKLFYNGTTFATTSNGRNAIFLLVLSSATSASNYYRNQGSFFLRFTDS